MSRLRHRPGVSLVLWLVCIALAGCATSGPDRPATQSSEDTGATDAVPAEQSKQNASQDVPASAFGPELLARPSNASLAPPADIWERMRRDFRLPAVAKRRLASEVARYNGRQSYFDIVARRARPYLRHILDRIEARGLPAELALVPVVESAFRPFAYSRSRAGGIWQFKPLTGRRFGLQQNWWYDGRRDVLASTDAALDYLEYLHGFFDGDWFLAIAAYNAGEGTVRNAVRRNASRGQPTDFWHLDLPAQTEKYVPRLLALRAIIQAPDAYEVDLPPLPAGESLTVVQLDGQVDLAVIARLAGIKLERLYRYNSGLNRWATPPNGPHRIAVPAENADKLRQALARRDPADMLRWRRHTVESGDTLSAIASSYGTTVVALQEANDIDGSAIRVGENLLVPIASRNDTAYTLSVENRRRARQSSGPDESERIEYRVRSGDTFWDIARRHGVDVQELASWNDMAPDDTLRPGQRLAIWVPSERAGRGGPDERMQRVEYTVQTGDSLYVIARRFNVQVASIRRWNGLKAGTILQPGQTLQLHVDVTRQADSS